MAEQKALIPN